MIVVSLLRGINVGGNNKIRMEDLRALYEKLGYSDVQTLLQSGNAVFRTKERDLVRIARKIEDGLEAGFGFRLDIIIRTPDELRSTVANSPFADRTGLDPSKLLVIFLAGEPGAEAKERVLSIKAEPEELYIIGREVFMYFPDGMARPRLPLVKIEKLLKFSGTGRNWNTVRKLLEMAAAMER